MRGAGFLAIWSDVEPAAGLLIVEALDEASLRSALRQAAEMTPDLFGGIGEPEIYQGMFAIDARIASVE